MTRRIVVTLCAAVGALAIGIGPAVANAPSSHDSDWACIGIDHLEFGVCQQNPLPERLDAPDEARVLPPEE